MIGYSGKIDLIIKDEYNNILLHESNGNDFNVNETHLYIPAKGSYITINKKMYVVILRVFDYDRNSILLQCRYIKELLVK